MELHNFECQICKATEKPLHIHHTVYKKGRNPWEYSDIELKCLCCDCHEQIEEEKTAFLEATAQFESYPFPFAELTRGIRRLLPEGEEVAATILGQALKHDDIIEELWERALGRDKKELP